MTFTSIPDTNVLAAFIGNVVIGWLAFLVILCAVLAVILCGAHAMARGTRRAPKHRLAQHCGVTAAADTALLPAIAPVYLGPPIETTQRLPHVHRVTTGATR